MPTLVEYLHSWAELKKTRELGSHVWYACLICCRNGNDGAYPREDFCSLKNFQSLAANRCFPSRQRLSPFWGAGATIISLLLSRGVTVGGVWEEHYASFWCIFGCHYSNGSQDSFDSCPYAGDIISPVVSCHWVGSFSLRWRQLKTFNTTFLWYFYEDVIFFQGKNMQSFIALVGSTAWWS